MYLMDSIFLFISGALVGFLSGLLGIGGGIIMFPVLLYLPLVFGLGEIGVKTATGLTIMQGFAASFTAVFSYRKRGHVNKALVLWLGVPLLFSSLAGAFYSQRVSDRSLLFLFGLLALWAAVMMFKSNSAENKDVSDEVVFNKALALGAAIVLGGMLGMLGQGGAFLLIPFMIYVLGVPFRVAAGSMLAIGVLTTSAALIGKAAVGQVDLALAVPMLLGTIPGAKLGALVTARVQTKVLKRILALVIMGAAVKIWLDII
jgi:uncharacterized membrane protein YfcA